MDHKFHHPHTYHKGETQYHNIVKEEPKKANLAAKAGDFLGNENMTSKISLICLGAVIVWIIIKYL